MKTVVSLVAMFAGAALAGSVCERTGGTVDPTGVEWTDLAGGAVTALSSSRPFEQVRSFAAPTNVTFYSLSCPQDAAADAEGFVPTMARDIALYGSNDGTGWTLVDEEPYSIGWKPGESRTWACAAPAAYSRYRLVVTANNGGATTAFERWRLYAPEKRMGATYYVDAEKGDDGRTADEAQEAATPWRTISKAAAAMVGGDTALVAPGVYREQVTIDKYHAAGTAVDPMTFRALDPNDRPVVSGAQLLDPSGWSETVVTNFAGREIACLVREIGWKTPALFAGLKRLVLAHEPDQVNGDDPYELEYMRAVSEAENPEPCSKARLVDSAFFVQPETDYWAGATLMVYDGYSNFIAEQPVIGYDPSAHSVTTGTFSVSIGSNRGKGDKWSLKDHLGILDAPGEFVVTGTSAPYRLYFVPPKGTDLATVAAVRHDYGFSTAKGGIVVDGFRFQSQAGAGFYGKSKPSRNLRLRNCEFCHILGDGADLRFWHSAGLVRCVVSANTDNGISFANGVNCHVFDCSVSTNGNNGIWSGTGGGKAYFNDTGLVVRGCDIFDQAGRRSHADNFQMHMNDNVVIEGNRFKQQGEQNGWCQYTGHLVFRNNVLTDGPFGFGSVRYADIAHNVFDSSQLRFDSHLDDHPEYGAWYCPIGIGIRANVIRTSSIAFPTSRLVDRFEAFDVAGNLYLFNSASANARKTWDWAGQVVTIKPGTLFVANDLIADTMTASASQPFETVSQITWSDSGLVMPLFKDALNYYWFGLGNNTTFNRVTNGVSEVLATYKERVVGVHHDRAVEITNRVTSVFSPTGIVFTVEKNGVEALTVVDSDVCARSCFTGSLRTGFGSETNASQNAWVQLVSARVGERIEDFSTLENWTVVTGSVSVVGAKGYGGVGLGEGSAMLSTNPVPAVADLGTNVLASVVTPDGLPVGPLVREARPDPSPDPEEPPAPAVLGEPIATASEFVAKACAVPSGEYTLTADIDLAGSGFKTITTFSGKLHGAGHVLSGLGAKPLATTLNGLVDGLVIDGTVDGAPTAVNGDSTGFAPLALTSAGCIVSNCTVRGYAIQAASKGGNVAGLVKAAKDGSLFVGCTVEDSVTLNGHVNLHVGGLVATVTSDADNGAFVARFVACTNRAAVGNSNGNYNSYGVGGLVGYVSHNAATIPATELIACVNEGRVSGAGNCNVGGLVGVLGGSGTTGNDKTQRVTFIDCLNLGPLTVSSDSSNAGGVIGACTVGAGVFSLTGCVNRASVSTTAKGWIGGLIGVHDAPNKPDVIRTTVVRCVNCGTLTGTNVGGFIGRMTVNGGWNCGKWFFSDSDNCGNIVAPMPGYAGFMSETSGQVYGCFSGTASSAIQIVIENCRGLNPVCAGASSSRAPTSADLTVFAPFAETPPAGCVGVLFQDWNGNVLAETNGTVGTTATAPADPVREGFTFIGWDRPFEPLAEPTAYQALYTVNRYAYRFDARGGSAVPTVEADYGTAVEEPVTTRGGHVFVGWSLDGTTKVGVPPLMTADDRTYCALWRPVEKSFSAFAKLRVLQWRVSQPNSKPGDTSAYAVGVRNVLTTNGVDIAVFDNYKSASYLAPITPEGHVLVGRAFNGSNDGSVRVVGWKASRFRQVAGDGSLLFESGKPASNSTSGWTVLEDGRTGHQYLVVSAWYYWAKGKTVESYLSALATQLAKLGAAYPAARMIFCADYSGMTNASSDFWTTYGGKAENVLAALKSATGLVPVRTGDDLQWTLISVVPKSSSARPVDDVNVSGTTGHLSSIRLGGDGFLIKAR